MSRGKGVMLQRYKEGGVSDASTFTKKEGLVWTDSSGRRFVHTDIKDYIGERAQAGRSTAQGLPEERAVHAAVSVMSKSETSKNEDRRRLRKLLLEGAMPAPTTPVTAEYFQGPSQARNMQAACSVRFSKIGLE